MFSLRVWWWPNNLKLVASFILLFVLCITLLSKIYIQIIHNRIEGMLLVCHKLNIVITSYSDNWFCKFREYF